MEKKKSKINKFITIIFLILLSIVIAFTIYKLNKKHEEKLYNVLYSEIKYQANQCLLKKECENNITIKELYEKKYLETKYDPITKEELNKEIKIIIKNEKIEIVE